LLHFSWFVYFVSILNDTFALIILQECHLISDVSDTYISWSLRINLRVRMQDIYFCCTTNKNTVLWAGIRFGSPHHSVPGESLHNRIKFNPPLYVVAPSGELLKTKIQILELNQNSLIPTSCGHLNGLSSRKLSSSSLEGKNKQLLLTDS